MGLTCRPRPSSVTYILLVQGSKLTIASGKFATRKFHLLPIEKLGSKTLLPRNSVVKVISGK